MLSENRPNGGLEKQDVPKMVFRELPLETIAPGENCRTVFEQESLDRLADTIRQSGLIQPLIVRPNQHTGEDANGKDGHTDTYFIICGERRYHAACKAGLTTVPAIIRLVEDEHTLALMNLLENLQREDLNAIDVATSYQKMSKRGYTQKQIGKWVGRDRSSIAHFLRLLKLPKSVQQDIACGLIDAGQARVLVTWRSDARKLSELVRLAKDGASVREMEKAARKAQPKPPCEMGVGRPMSFRGLRNAPLNEQGVVYLFGMLSYELGFHIEAIRTMYPDCEGLQRKDKKGREEWKRVRIEFEYQSSNFRAHGHNPKECDIIVCWIHDWKECKLEVVELSKEIRRLPAQLPDD